MEVKESAEGILAESLHLPYHLFKRFPLRKASRFGKEFIGIADKFLFQGNGTHIPMRESLFPLPLHLQTLPRLRIHEQRLS